MQFMVVEQFRNQDAKPIYRRLHEKGRMMPEGLRFVSSHVAADFSRCFQLMECDDVTPVTALGGRMVGPHDVRDCSGRRRQGHGGGA